MTENLRKILTGGPTSVLKRFLAFTAAVGLAASMTLGAAPVSATPSYSWSDWELEVDNLTPQWGDEIEFSATVDWSDCKRIPIVYLLGTSDNGDPISVRLTGERIGSSKTYTYAISYGGVDLDGVPYDYELTPAERSALNDTRLAAGYHSFELKATSTRANCASLNRVQYTPAVEFYVGPHFTDVSFTTNATFEVYDDYTSGLVSVLDENDEDFTAGVYAYELTSQVGDASSGLDWIEVGEIVGDVLTVDASAGIDWDDNLTGMNCYLDEPVDLTGDPIVDGHHLVGDSDAVDCAAIEVDLGEHTLTIERWIDSCSAVELDCLSWLTYTFDFARVENQDAIPYLLDFVDHSTGVSLTEDEYTWDLDAVDATNRITLGPDDTNGIEIVADLPFGSDLSCIYNDDDGVELSAGDSFEPLAEPGETYLVCTVTPEDPSAESFEYTVTIDRVSGNVEFSELRVFTENEGELDVTPYSIFDEYDEEVDYTAGLASFEDETAGIELTLVDESTHFECWTFESYMDPSAGIETDCSSIDLNTPYDATTGVWIYLEAEDGSNVWHLLMIEHDVVGTDATLDDASTGLQFIDSYGTFEVAMCSDFAETGYLEDYVDFYTPFNGDPTIDWCVVDEDPEFGWYLYGTDDTSGTWFYTPNDPDYDGVACENDRFDDDSGDCDDRALASRTDNEDDVLDGWNEFTMTVTAEDEVTTEDYSVSVYRVDDNARLQDLKVYTKAGVLMQLRDNEGDPVDFDEDTYAYWVNVRAADQTGAPLLQPNGIDINETRWDADVQDTDCLKGYVPTVTGAMSADCDNTVIPEDADGDYAVDVTVTAENGEESTYTIYFTFDTFFNGLNTLTVEGEAVDDSTGLSFDTDDATLWYYITTESAVDVGFTVGDLPGLGGFCYVADVNVSCTNISLPESAWKSVQVRTYTGGAGGSLQRTYFIVIYRKSTNATLSNLTATDVGGSGRTLSPTFSSGVLSYNVTSLTGTVDLDYTTSNVEALAACDPSCEDIDVNAGPVTVTITVTAEDEETEVVYEVTITKVPPVPAPVYLSSASVLGTQSSGRTLSASVGTWRYQPTYAYQWFSCTSRVSLQRGGGTPAGCSAIDGATAGTYRLVSTNRGKFILVRITGTNAGGTTVIFTNSTGAIR